MRGRDGASRYDDEPLLSMSSSPILLVLNATNTRDHNGAAGCSRENTSQPFLRISLPIGN
jgi:hypothetical protein